MSPELRDDLALLARLHARSASDESMLALMAYREAHRAELEAAKAAGWRLVDGKWYPPA